MNKEKIKTSSIDSVRVGKALLGFGAISGFAWILVAGIFNLDDTLPEYLLILMIPLYISFIRILLIFRDDSESNKNLIIGYTLLFTGISSGVPMLYLLNSIENINQDIIRAFIVGISAPFVLAMIGVCFMIYSIYQSRKARVSYDVGNNESAFDLYFSLHNPI